MATSSNTLASPPTDNHLEILNISCYKFAPLCSLKERKEKLQRLTSSLRLKGTILLSEEGINLFVAGRPHAVAALVEELRQDPHLADLTPKESYSADQPFSKMLIKIKKEIIAFGVEGVKPYEYTSRKLPAAELKAWLDAGKPVTLLDTRNDYEYDLGTFENAVTLPIRHFRKFPDAIAQLPDTFKQQPIVMFCTGGIRCEKAGPFMEQAGFQEIYQLEGGILKYFEEVGGDHYNGECFVFDKRVAVDPGLSETATTQCYGCLMPLTPHDQTSPLYLPGVHCPHCYDRKHPKFTPDEVLAKKQQQLRQRSLPLPGSLPYANERPINVSQTYDGCEVLDFLAARHPQVSRQEWLALINDGKVLFRGHPVSPEIKLVAGDRLTRIMPELSEPDVNANITLLFENNHLLIVNKPAPLPVHSCGRFHKNTLVHLLKLVYNTETLRPAHRLDANTSGIMVLSRNRIAAAMVQTQFERGEVEKTYLARVLGTPTQQTFEVNAPISAEPTAAGLRIIDDNGLPAQTRFHVRQQFADGTTLLEVQPLTGRTNQIRLHLWHLGLPILGDQSYLPNHQLGTQQTLSVDEPAMCLHAWKLIFAIDTDGERREFETPLPSWASQPSY